MSEVAGDATGQVDDLYLVDPDEFVAARNLLAKQLRAERRREEAAVVAKMRRPPVTAWALNLVARQRPELVAEVLARGAILRAAMHDAVLGDASSLRPAQTASRRAVDAAVDAAHEVIAASGRLPTDVMGRRMAETLRASGIDDAVGAQVRAGVLAADVEASGFGLDAEGFDAAAPPAPAAPPADDGEDEAEEPAEAAPTEEAERAEEAAPTEEAEPEEEAAAAERAEDDRLRASWEEASRRLEAAAEEAERLERRLARWQAAAAEARTRADSARAAATAAAAELAAATAAMEARGVRGGPPSA